MLQENTSVLVVIDFQGNLAHSMYDKEHLLENAKKLILGAKLFHLPIITTEQIPEKIGSTLPEISACLGETTIISKTTFSCCENDTFGKIIKAANRKQILLCGIEAHICVYQTAIDLLVQDYNVHVVADTVSSRTCRNRDIALQCMVQAGCFLTSAEMALFELLKTARNSHFKEILRLVK